MPRKLRYVPEPGTLFEITCRTFQGRMLLRPSRILNESIVGTIAVAQKRYGVEVVCVVVLSNHLHLLLRVTDAQQLARFQCFVGSKIAREVARLTGWREKVWGRRYSAIPVSSEPAAQIERLRYLLSHGVKENLVERCADWPGVHSADSLVCGRPIAGFWFDRTAEFNATRRDKDVSVYSFATPEVLTLARLPCWQHLSALEYQERISEMISDLEADARRDRREKGFEALGQDVIRHQDPFAKPTKFTRSPIPWIHAVRRATRLAFRKAYRLFELAYREAAQRLRSGIVDVSFPAGCFPPAMAFVGS